MKIAIVHDWLLNIGGSEKCLESIYSLFPDADVFTLVSDDEVAASLGIDNKKVRNSFIQKLPRSKEKYRYYLPFFPIAIEQFDLSSYDIILSSSHAVAKGVLTNNNQLHICYCYTPIRYAWDLYHQYLRESGLVKGFKGKLAKIILHYIRIWDYTTANRVDHFIAISRHVADRIRRVYSAHADVIYPPVDVNKFGLHSGKEDFYLTVSRFVPYKMIDLIMDAFSMMPDKKLVVIGNGPELKKIKAKAGRNIEMLGWQKPEVIRDYMQRAKAFVFAAEEDFGIAPVEAQACGTPVIAYRRGGVLETVVENKTGIFFNNQATESLMDAIDKFEKNQEQFDCNEIRRNAERFGKERFMREFKDFVESKVKDFFGGAA